MIEYENRWSLPDWKSALLWTRARNVQGMKVVLDILGEASKTLNDAEVARDAYLDLVTNISNERLYASISVKASSLGYTLDRSACLDNILAIAKESAARKVGFEMDMEGRSLVDFTLEAAGKCSQSKYPITLALQAYLDRTPMDINAAITSGIRVRLVKGAYVGDVVDYMDIQGRFKNLARILIDSGASFCVSTHDSELIVWTTMKAAEISERVEFGMLKGLSDQTKLDFIKNKWRVSEYVPFGSSKAAYESRRRAYLRMLESIGRQSAP
ncbi:MAG: proline dehydrogenase family protein [Methanomassiliicoccales archaeon]|jgi:proline dehydrogenase|nr:proline dehydrogenase family protein [Methanomassiliicoccales archaeon]MDD1755252.1 proline dehydrogenase family protein [Methanomassiliicoccales archaeon]